MSSQPPSVENNAASFEELLRSLEEIVRVLEEGQIGLTESLAKYEQGVGLLKQCYEQLQKAERRIEVLTRVDATGTAVTSPFDDTPSREAAEADQSGSATRSRRRSARTAPRTNEDECVDGPKPETEIDVRGRLF